MRKLFVVMCLAGAVLSACQKTVSPDVAQTVDETGNVPMVFTLGNDLVAEVTSKAAVVETDDVTSVCWVATTGTVGSDTKVYGPSTVTKAQSGTFDTGLYWPSTDVDYNYYVSNADFSFNDTSHKAEITVANNSVDVVAGKAAASYKSSPTVTLDHIFARTGSFTLKTQTGYEIVGTTTWTIVGKSEINGKAGVFNIGTGKWTSASSKITADTSISSSSDMYILPGTYTVKVTYTLKKGDYQETFTNKQADIEIVGGKVNNVTATAIGGAASEIIFSLSVTPWDDNDITIEELK